MTCCAHNDAILWVGKWRVSRGAAKALKYMYKGLLKKSAGQVAAQERAGEYTQPSMESSRKTNDGYGDYKRKKTVKYLDDKQAHLNRREGPF